MKIKVKTFLWAVFIILFAVFSLTLIKTIRQVLYSSGTRSGMIKVQGRVYYDVYKKEDIIIYWRRDLTRGTPVPGNRPLVVKRIPGAYSIYIPKDIAGFYICARGNIVKGRDKNHSVAYFISDFITVDPKKETIYTYIYLKKRKVLMDDYAGKTVKISGKVSQANYTRGFISIAVETPQNYKKVFLPPDIAQKFIPRTGDYDIKVPAGIGRVYIHALNYPDKDCYGDMPGVVSASYKNNPVDIGNFDIEGVDIVIE